MKNCSEVINKMKKEYSHLIEMGADIRGVFGPDADLLKDKAFIKESPQYEDIIDCINIWIPFVFDHRSLPKIYEGIPVQVIIISDSIPNDYFKDGKKSIFFEKDIDKPEDYIEFVDAFEDEIKTTLKNQNLTKKEILNALAYGDFEEYIKHYEMKDFDYMRIRKINASSFKIAFEKFINRKYSNKENDRMKLATDWSSDTFWTKAILGHNEGINLGSPLGNALRFHYGKGFNYQNEFYNLDLILTRDESINYQNLNNEDIQAEMFWPDSLEIILEHENKIECCWEEMIKLTYLRAKLKVLISYLPDNIDDDYRKFIIDTVKENFKRIIGNANKMHPENPETEYLLILGWLCRNKNEIELKWHYESIQVKEIF